MSSALGEQVRAVRTAAGLFWSAEDAPRAVVSVSGSDARRWLDGMISNDVTQIAPGGQASGCYATLLTTKGRILADLNVLAREDDFWLETSATAVASVVAGLERYIVADDVTLRIVTGDSDRLGLEGPESASILARAAGAPSEEAALLVLPPGSWRDLIIADAPVLAARFGWSGEVGYQLFVPPGARDRIVAALEMAAPLLARVGDDALEVLRVEAGIPKLAAELDEEVFPDEARLDAAISRSKGCYTGQEIVARLYSRGAVNHLLVALRFEGDTLPAPDTALLAGERRTGEITSAVDSPTEGAIGLGFVRVEHAEPGTQLQAGSVTVRVADLPLVAGGTRGEASRV